jgi:hypothetical protein
MDNTKQQDPAAKTVDPRYPDTPIGIVRSRDAFLRDLPTLLANPKYDRWFALYCGEARVAVAETRVEIRRAVEQQGLRPDEYHIGCIFPRSDEEVEEVDTGFYEFEDIVDDDTNEPTNGSVSIS